MSYRFPSCALVRFPKLVALAHHETEGLMRQISKAAVKLICDDMKKVGVMKDKFGKPTINLSCDQNDETYRRFFAPFQEESITMLNMDSTILNLEGFPVLQIAPHLLRFIHFTDGRHRIVATEKAFPCNVQHSYVLCSITVMQDYQKMKLDSYRKSEERPYVYASIHDALQCLKSLFGRGYEIDNLRKDVKRLLGYSKTHHVDIICKLQVHLFSSSKKMMDVHRDSKLFTPELLFRTSTKPFITFIQECGRLQLNAYRYNLTTVFGGLHVKERLQNACIHLCVRLSENLSSVREKEKVMFALPNSILQILKKIANSQQKLEGKDVALLLAVVFRDMMSEVFEKVHDRFLIHCLRTVFPGNEEAVRCFVCDDESREKSDEEQSELLNDKGKVSTEQQDIGQTNASKKRRKEGEAKKGIRFKEGSTSETVKKSSAHVSDDLHEKSQLQNVMTSMVTNKSKTLVKNVATRRKSTDESMEETSIGGKRGRSHGTNSSYEREKFVKRRLIITGKSQQHVMRRMNYHDSRSTNVKTDGKVMGMKSKVLKIRKEPLCQLFFLHVREKGLTNMSNLLSNVTNLDKECVFIADGASLKRGILNSAINYVRKENKEVCAVILISKEQCGEVSSEMGCVLEGEITGGESMERLFRYKIFLKSSSKWKGPIRIREEYGSDAQKEDILDSLSAMLVQRVEELTVRSSMVFDFMLGLHSRVLRAILQTGFTGVYYKCLTVDQENARLHEKYLQILEDNSNSES